MKKFLSEFKTFALRGNVLNLAVGVIIGAAFQGVVSSLTENILSPIIGLVSGQNFDQLKVEFLGITLKYGAFLTSVVNFLILAFVVFLLVSGINKLLAVGTKPEPEVDPTTKKCKFCLSEIPVGATRCPHCTSELGA